MINHSTCDHPSTPSSRSKCRRAKAAGKVHTGGATAIEVNLSKESTSKKSDSYGQTPRDRDKQCDVCGVERIAWFGLDIISGVQLYVGEKCFYMVKRDPDGPVELA